MRVREAVDITGAYFLLCFAFAVVFARGVWWSDPFSIKGFLALKYPLSLSLPTLGIAFIAHELNHRAFALRYGARAKFKAWWLGLAITVIIASIVGIIIALPGGVMVKNALSKSKMGKVALAGPLTNLALIPLFFGFATQSGFVFYMGVIGLIITSVLALFNSLPIWELDGHRIWKWSSLAGLAIVISSVVAVIGSIYYAGEVGFFVKFAKILS